MKTTRNPFRKILSTNLMALTLTLIFTLAFNCVQANTLENIDDLSLYPNTKKESQKMQYRDSFTLRKPEQKTIQGTASKGHYKIIDSSGKQNYKVTKKQILDFFDDKLIEQSWIKLEQLRDTCWYSSPTEPTSYIRIEAYEGMYTITWLEPLKKEIITQNLKSVDSSSPFIGQWQSTGKEKATLELKANGSLTITQNSETHTGSWEPVSENIGSALLNSSNIKLELTSENNLVFSMLVGKKEYKFYYARLK